MKNKSTQKTTVSKVIRLVKRLDATYLPLMIVTQCMAAIQPYILLWAGSRVLDMILEKYPMEDTMRFVLWTVLGTMVLGLIRWILEGVLSVKRNMLRERVTVAISEKSLQLDYEVLEKQETLEMIHRAKEGMNSNGNIASFCDQLGSVVALLAGIVYSLVLFAGACIPVKDVEVVNGNTLTVVLNSGWSPLLLLGICVLMLFWALAIQKGDGVRTQKNFDRNVKYNRRFGYFFGFLTRYKEGKDIRLYQMEPMITRRINNTKINAYPYPLP